VRRSPATAWNRRKGAQHANIKMKAFNAFGAGYRRTEVMVLTIAKWWRAWRGDAGPKVANLGTSLLKACG